MQAISGQINLSTDLIENHRKLEPIRARRNKGRTYAFGHVMGVVSSTLNSKPDTAGKTLAHELGLVDGDAANGDGATNAQDAAAVQARLGAVFGGPNYDHRADLNRDGAINAADTALAQSCGAEWPYQAYLPRAWR